MTVTGKEDVATLTMTTEELATLRYTLRAGAESLTEKAQYAKRVKLPGNQSIAETATRAERVQRALEHAVQQ